MFRKLFIIYSLIILFIFMVVVKAENVSTSSQKPKNQHFQIFSVDWSHVQAAYTVTIWILVASIAKILFHVNKKFGDALPDSACLIVVGLIVGYLLKEANVNRNIFSLDSTTFFLYLLPPIIFDAGYFMPNRQLFENFDSVMVFAFIGTIFNTLAIASTLYLCGNYYNLFSVEFSLFEILLFASLISAVDPVAVIAVFEEINVIEFLFINVFGEALFNDGAAVVLYLLFKKFNYIGPENLITSDYVAGGLSFFVITFGGIFIGVVCAAVVSFETKFTDPVKILAPVLIFAFPYLAYLTAEMLGVSSIFAIITCGIAMKEYVKGNVSQEAIISVKYFTKLLAQSSETIIFMFLGLSTISSDHLWDTNFVIITILSCLIFRTIGVVAQCTLLNCFRTKQFTPVDQFVLSYGGLRGAIAFGLAVSMPGIIIAKPMFITTTIAVIFFTVFVQGISIRPLLNWLNVEKADDRQATMAENIYNRYCDYTMSGIEDIAGQKGKHSIRHFYERINAKILKPILIKSFQKQTFDASQIVRAYTKITLQEAMEVVEQGQQKPSSIPRSSSNTSNSDIQSGPPNLETSPPPKNAATSYAQFEMDSLYKMFSQLLDRKIDEIRGAVQNEVETVRGNNLETDIADDYIGMMRRNYAFSSPDLQAASQQQENQLQNSSNHELYHRQQSHPIISTRIMKY